MTFEEPFKRITAEEDKCFGKPCIRGIRMPVLFVLRHLAHYPDRKDFLEEFPDLEEEDVRQALHFASVCLENMRMPIQSTDEDGEPVLSWIPRGVDGFPLK